MKNTYNLRMKGKIIQLKHGKKSIEQIFYQILYKNIHRASGKVLGATGSLGKCMEIYTQYLYISLQANNVSIKCSWHFKKKEEKLVIRILLKSGER